MTYHEPGVNGKSKWKITVEVERESKKTTEDFLAIRWKDNDELTRDPYGAFYLSGNRYLMLSSIPGNMRYADVERFTKKLIDGYSMA